MQGKKDHRIFIVLSSSEDTEDDGTESDTNKNGKAGMALSTIVNKQEQISPLYLGRKTLQNCFACVYVGKDKPQLFIGKTSKQILLDKNGLVDALKIDCLKPHIGSGSIPVLVSP